MIRSRSKGRTWRMLRPRSSDWNSGHSMNLHVMCTGKETTHNMSPACSFLGHSQPHSLLPRLRWMISKKPPAQLSATSSTHRLRGCRSQTTKAIKQKIPPTVSCAAFQIDIYSQQEHVQVMHAADGACLAFSSLCLIESLLA